MFAPFRGVESRRWGISAQPKIKRDRVQKVEVASGDVLIDREDQWPLVRPRRRNAGDPGFGGCHRLIWTVGRKESMMCTSDPGTAFGTS
jgi:hypothetical protein